MEHLLRINLNGCRVDKHASTQALGTWRHECMREIEISSIVLSGILYNSIIYKVHIYKGIDFGN